MPEPGSGCSLRGLGVLVTRPAHQADGLCGLIERSGGRAIRFPALEIKPCDQAAAQKLLQQRWDLMVYISANAVRHGVTAAASEMGPIAAVGKSTARALQAVGLDPDLVPDRADSEALLALPELADVRGWRILIVRGRGGRALLADTLRQRGALVQYAEVYRRMLPEVDPSPLLERWTEDVQIVTTSSIQVLDNLVRLLGDAGRSKLRATPLLVVSERMEHRARELGLGKPWRASGADEQSMVRTLCRMAEEAY